MSIKYLEDHEVRVSGGLDATLTNFYSGKVVTVEGIPSKLVGVFVNLSFPPEPFIDPHGASGKLLGDGEGIPAVDINII